MTDPTTPTEQPDAAFPSPEERPMVPEPGTGPSEDLPTSEPPIEDLALDSVDHLPGEAIPTVEDVP